MEKEFKHLRVKESTHKRIKVLCSARGEKVDDTINLLLDFYNKNKFAKKCTLSQ